jgi:hypothetical protein
MIEGTADGVDDDEAMMTGGSAASLEKTGVVVMVSSGTPLVSLKPMVCSPTRPASL